MIILDFSLYKRRTHPGSLVTVIFLQTFVAVLSLSITAASKAVEIIIKHGAKICPPFTPDFSTILMNAQTVPQRIKVLIK